MKNGRNNLFTAHSQVIGHFVFCVMTSLIVLNKNASKKNQSNISEVIQGN
jgi:hypothetical protein